MTDRRCQPRLPHTELVVLSWKENARKVSQLAQVQDVALDAMGVVVHSPIPVGTTVTISCASGELKGVVRHATQLVDGYCLGIEFADADSALEFQSRSAIWRV